MKKFNYIILFVALSCASLAGYAQESRNLGIINSYLRGWLYEVKAGFNIGGTAPLPLPKEIREINSYSPGIAISIEGNATKWFTQEKKWGLTVGLKLETKSMTTDASTKNYSMKIISAEGGSLEGLWTGDVNTKARFSYVTLPIVINYGITPRWKVNAGPYVSYVTSCDFSGHVSDGHIRTPNETGSRVDFIGENKAVYDFSDNLRRFQWGLQVGASWRAFKHLNVYADLCWGLNDIFEKDFDTVTFNMYPIYANIGFGYAF